MENDDVFVRATFRAIGQKAAGVFLGLALIGTTHATDAISHFFDGAGAVPKGDVTIIGSELYGLTSEGGLNNAGTLFKLNANGSGFSVLQSLSSGSNPSGSLVLGGSTLYGMTYGGGTGSGAIFKIDANGGNFSSFYNFTGAADNGVNPLGSLVLSGSTLYGMTQFGGAAGTGAIFSINVDGSGFNLLHSFVGGNDDGSLPFGSLVLSGSILYGTTANGGSASSGGTVFKMDLSDSSFQVIHSFGSGSNPEGSLILVGSTLYGTTTAGGSGSGTVFQVGTDGLNYDVLHTFGGSDGSVPSGALTLVGSTLYGTTSAGGANGLGTVFQLSLDGTVFDLVHSFAGGTDDGANPLGSLVLLDGRLYGTTSAGGPNDIGTVFSVAAVPEPCVIALCVAGGLLTLLHGRVTKRRAG